MQLFGTDLGRAATEAAVAGQQVLWNVDLGHPAKPTRLDRRRVGGGAETAAGFRAGAEPPGPYW
ncbi:hypothetical protein GCM10022630_21220 [Thermobifida alba]